MPALPPNGHTSNGTPDPSASRSEHGMNITELLTEAEELRTVVLDASARLARLIAGLKQHRRRSRAEAGFGAGLTAAGRRGGQYRFVISCRRGAGRLGSAAQPMAV